MSRGVGVQTTYIAAGLACILLGSMMLKQVSHILLTAAETRTLGTGILRPKVNPLERTLYSLE